MVFILNKKLNSNKKLFYELKKIYGLNFNRINLLFKIFKFEKNFLPKDLTSKQILLLNKFLKKSFSLEKNLKSQQIKNIKSLIRISSYRGLRHSKKLPVHGQRTHSNAKTQRKKNIFKN